MDTTSPPFFVDGSALQLILTKSRHEKMVAAALDQFGIPCYLPLIKKVKKYKKGRATHEIPLFPNYVISHEPGELRQKMFAISQHLVSVVPVPEASRQLLLDELDTVRRVVDTQTPLEACDEIKIGQAVRLKRGPFKDLEGIVVENRGTLKFIINVHMLGQSISAEVDPADLKMI
jgi:transcription antitermination factor NusG